MDPVKYLDFWFQSVKICVGEFNSNYIQKPFNRSFTFHFLSFESIRSMNCIKLQFVFCVSSVFFLLIQSQWHAQERLLILDVWPNHVLNLLPLLIKHSETYRVEYSIRSTFSFWHFPLNQERIFLSSSFVCILCVGVCVCLVVCFDERENQTVTFITQNQSFT